MIYFRLRKVVGQDFLIARKILLFIQSYLKYRVFQELSNYSWPIFLDLLHFLFLSVGSLTQVICLEALHMEVFREEFLSPLTLKSANNKRCTFMNMGSEETQWNYNINNPLKFSSQDSVRQVPKISVGEVLLKWQNQRWAIYWLENISSVWIIFINIFRCQYVSLKNGSAKYSSFVSMFNVSKVTMEHVWTRISRIQIF